MKVLAFDGRMGASGDMLLGALVAAGADPASLAPVEAALDVRYAVGETTKNGIRATTVDVIPAHGEDPDRDGPDHPDGPGGSHDREHDHRHDRQADHRHDHDHQRDQRREHDHRHEHDHAHTHHHDHEGSHCHGSEQADHEHPDAAHEHDRAGHDDHHDDDHRDGGHDHPEDAPGHRSPGRAEGTGPHRTYPEVVDLVSGMGLPDGVEADALAVFERLGEAEASVHGTDLESTHFHEVGADDAVADVVGAALLLADLAPDRVVTTPLSTGGGEVAMSHGRYPVPPPAVVEIAEGADWSIRGGPVDAELLTPTGAAILAHVADGIDRLPAVRVTASGYGAGDRDFPEHPNVLRAIVGDVSEDEPTPGRSAEDVAGRGGGLVHDEVRVLETNVDDVPPEVLGGLQETLTEAGARDVSFVPLSMKKSRPGHLVSVVVKPEDVDRVARRLADETGTLGIRETGARHRWIADRRFVTATLAVDGSRHEVTVKVAADAGGEVYDVSAEYADAAGVARRTDLPTREVMRRAESAAREGGALSPVLLHVVEAEAWRAVEDDEDRYAPPSVEAEGVVHLSPPERVVGVAQYNYPDADEPRLLVVERESIEPPVKYEETDSGAFPHAYGALNVDAVVDVLPFPREGGRYRLPDGLGEWTTGRAE